ncbi:unnamed protein product [Microthlaspi erraticum]|uniref:Uncharacterized protein n=1 Tax=Microthlaspi erraticum TaxID=1685480 RepID=A0A6D2JGQ3_9BRAS|nr:unnamed protein product [Microthlaspi erraticum]CAA7049007.1 unnamed protein product [Microthlaspi erraticum]
MKSAVWGLSRCPCKRVSPLATSPAYLKQRNVTCMNVKTDRAFVISPYFLAYRLIPITLESIHILRRRLLLRSLLPPPSIDSYLIEIVVTREINGTAARSNATSVKPNEDSFADMIDRALEKEFPENDQNEGNKSVVISNKNGARSPTLSPLHI